jgi:ppGpp synthetase/RelA/SpoT-type nucleotidyltranferase
MATLAIPQYSKRQVVETGKLLATEIYDYKAEGVIEAFRIAHNWRDAHVRPLRLVRSELVGKLKSAQIRSPTAGRVKRMKAIRAKLKKGRLTLYQMQDVGGCRVILPTMGQVSTIISNYKAKNTKHEMIREYDYIMRPKPDGYRCCHLVFKFCGAGDDEIYNRQQIEMQVRTQLQHAWATAVEAVGLYRSEDLKAGFGNSSWLRFF